jgi:hypothetical protein
LITGGLQHSSSTKSSFEPVVHWCCTSEISNDVVLPTSEKTKIHLIGAAIQ